MDKISESRLALVHPLLGEKVHKLAEMTLQEGVEIRVVQGLRSWNEQQSLYDQGRTRPGKIVTKCLPGHSWHNFGMAVDIAPDDTAKPLWQPNWKSDHPVWKRLVVLAKTLGFICGAEFRTFPDNPHFQMTGRFPVNPTDEVRQLFKDGGTQAVWDESGL
mgnify:CR=1 FL=1